MENNEKNSILDDIYNIKLEELSKCTEDIKEKLNNVSIEELQTVIEKNIDNIGIKNKLLDEINLLIENYEIKMIEYAENAYKQGFKDAFNLFAECLKK